MVITFGRQHGTNGHAIASKLAEQLGYPCYSKTIVDYAAENSNFSKEVLRSYDEKRVSSFIVPAPHYVGLNEGFHLSMQLATAQFAAVKKLAEDGNCIFVGRCADYVLRKRDDLVRVFIMGDMESRITELARRKGLTREQAKKLIKEVDKDRSSYYKYYTDQIWGEARNYDICLDSSRIGIDGSVEVLKAYISAFEK